MMATQMGNMIQASSTKPMRLLLYRAKPALLNAEIEWKTPCQIAWSQVWS